MACYLPALAWSHLVDVRQTHFLDWNELNCFVSYRHEELHLGWRACTNLDGDELFSVKIVIYFIGFLMHYFTL